MRGPSSLARHAEHRAASLGRLRPAACRGRDVSRHRLLLLLAAGFIFVSGCGGGSAPVDPDKARQTLSVVLDAWKKHESPAALRKASPEIVVQDPDWNAGTELESFELLGEGTRDNANLRCKVRLTLRGANGKSVEKQVGYVVGTSPVLTVFRDLP